MSVSINGTSGVVFNDASTQNTAATGFGFKNRIINGAMVVNQRAASVTDSGYVTDRWQYAASVASKATVSQDTSVYPTGFNASLKVLSSSAYTVGAGELFIVRQAIEGFNFADMGWGTANAKPITISFWVYSSLTGTFGGALQNGAQNRSYPFTYAISAANTWEQKTVTIAGDTSGTWVGATNGAGVYVFLGLGCGSSVSGTANTWAGATYWSATGAVSVVGTNAATWYITGVQLEKGSTATSFDYRPYGTELALCQRYFTLVNSISGYEQQTTTATFNLTFPVAMRTTPTIAALVPLQITDGQANYTQSSASAGTYGGNANGGLLFSIGNFTGLTATRPIVFGTTMNNPMSASAEL